MWSSKGRRSARRRGHRRPGARGPPGRLAQILLQVPTRLLYITPSPGFEYRPLDLDARRFYETHGFSCTHGQPSQREPYYSRELA